MPGFRLDRLLTLYFFYPLARQKGQAGEKKIPILMYHSISDDKEKATHPYYHINTSPAVFAEQMRFLSENNYSVVDLHEIDNCLNTNNALTRKFAVITFDDGYRDFYTNAFPILLGYHFPATVFLPTYFIENEKNKLRGKEHLTWNQASEMSARGISFGSHTVTHPELSSLSSKDVEYEIRHSKKVIETNLAKSINTFSYPFKFPDENKTFTKDLREILIRHQYYRGVSTRIGTTSIDDDRYFSKRIPINSGDDIALFQAKLEGGYDWLYHLQKLRKSMRSRA